MLGAGPDNSVHLDGVRWDIENDSTGACIEKGDFVDTFIKPDKVKDVYLMIKPFADQPRGLPGHALLKFEMQPDAPITNSKGQTDSALAISVEAHFHQGEKYDPNTKNPVIYQLGTYTDAIEKATLNDHDPLNIYKLNLNHDQKVALLNERLQAACQDHSSDTYDAVTNSCLSTLIDGVNKVIPEAQQIPHTLPDGSPDPSASVPVWCPGAFQAHGLLVPGKPQVIPAIPDPNAPPPSPPPAGTPTLPPGAFNPTTLQG